LEIKSRKIESDCLLFASLSVEKESADDSVTLLKKRAKAEQE